MKWVFWSFGMSEPGELYRDRTDREAGCGSDHKHRDHPHRKQLGSRENILQGEADDPGRLSDGGIPILNGDDDMLCRTRGKAGVKTVYYGTGETCDYRAVDIVLMDGKTEFTTVHAGKPRKSLLNVMGNNTM